MDPPQSAEFDTRVAAGCWKPAPVHAGVGGSGAHANASGGFTAYEAAHNRPDVLHARYGFETRTVSTPSREAAERAVHSAPARLRIGTWQLGGASAPAGYGRPRGRRPARGDPAEATRERHSLPPCDSRKSGKQGNCKRRPGNWHRQPAARTDNLAAAALGRPCEPGTRIHLPARFG